MLFNTFLLLQTLMNALMLSGLYVLVAAGLSLVLGVLHIINFAHGAFLMIGAFGVWLLVEKETTAIEAVPDWLLALQVPYPLAFLLAVLAVGLLGAFVNRVLYQRFWGQVLPCLIVAVGLTQILQQGFYIAFGIHTKSVPTYFEGMVSFLGIRFPLERVMIIVVAAVLVTALLLLLRYTRIGLAMRAVAQDSDAAAVQGVNIPRTATIAMLIGCGMAAAAGGIITPVFNVHAYMADGLLIKAFMVIILGGMGSVTGAIWAGLMVGFIDAFGTAFIGHYTQILLLVIVMTVIVFKPTGLFGGIVFEVFTKEEERADG